MQTVSQAWKNAHKQTLLNESYVEVSLDITDPDATKDASATDNGAVYISDTPEVVKEVDTPVIPYGTLEQNAWLLNGTRRNIPESNYLDGGFVGDAISNEEGIFTSKIPTITIDFGKVYTQVIPGVTITWGTAYNEYAEQFVVTAYNDNTIVAQKEILTNKSVVSIVPMDINNYNRITIQILRWCLPNHRARVDEIFIGLNKVYSKSELFSYSHEQAVDPISTSLPKMEIKFSIDNSDNSYNPHNPNNLAKYLTERQEVKTRYGLKLNDGTVEWIKGGSFYLSEWYAKQNGISAEFVARDLLEFMSEQYKDDVSDISERSLYNLAEQVLQAAKLPLNSDGTVKWALDNSLKSIYTKAPLPNDTMANCLQLIANMGCCVLYPNRNGKIHIESIIDNRYQRVEYIESTGTQYIDTGVIPTIDTTVECEIAQHTGDRFIYGSRTSATASDKHTFNFSTNNQIYPQLWSSNTDAISYRYNLGDVVTIKNGKDGAFVNGALVKSYTGVTFTESTLPMYLFGLNTPAEVVTKRSFVGRIYFFKIWEKGTLIRDYVPCYRKSDGVIGLYEKVSGNFYTNAGTNSFIKGEDIEDIKTEHRDYVINHFNSYSKSEISLSKQIKQVIVKVYDYSKEGNEIKSSNTEISVNIGEVGETITVDNPLVTDSDRARILGTWIGNYLKNRMTLKSTVRADVSLDALDIVTNENDYSTNTMRMTNVKFEFNGAFRGTGEGRVI